MNTDAIAAALAASDVAALVAAATALVKADPAQAAPRIALFQALLIDGQWERAITQAQVAADLSAEAIPMARTYEAAVSCEKFRGEVFAGRRSPLVLGEPLEWLAWLVQALERDAAAAVAEAAALRERAFDAAPATPGEADGEAFDWIADADSRLGPVLEAVISGKYYWVPFQRLAAIEFDAPSDLRDFVWLPATLTLAGGGQMPALVPSRYPGSERSEDGAIKLARRTEWREFGPDAWAGEGQRLLATSAGDRALLECRAIRLQAAD
ncbi:MAG: virulence protein SciE type [Burkholderiales bacterium]|nr:MAG: virulence protein SciE type [Burkholderiales bacterium]